MSRFVAMALSLLAVSIVLPVSSSLALASKKLPDMKTVSYVDVDRYLGLWYEIARFPNSFQKGCDSATAEYSLVSEGTIRVFNTCLSSKNDKVRTADGQAKIADRNSNAKLKVTFLPKWLRFLNIGLANYWIIDLDVDYRWVVVSEPSRKFMWILSREPQMSQDVYEGILKRAQEQDLDVSKLIASRPGSVTQ
jgi:apolipoprotein D and lipocalin family protein